MGGPGIASAVDRALRAAAAATGTGEAFATIIRAGVGTGPAFEPGEARDGCADIPAISTSNMSMHKGMVTVEAGDINLMMSAVIAEPELTDMVRWNGAEYQIVNVKKTRFSQTGLVFYVLGRKPV